MLRWVELQATNADDTTATWSNVPQHDGQVPPWSTLVIQRGADFNELHAAMQASRSSNKPARLAPADFPRHFESQ